MEYFTYPLFAFMFIAALFTISNLSSELKRSNKLLEKIANHIGAINPPISALEDEEFNLYISKQEKIKAIKRYRELTGEGLREAKDYVDSLFK